MILNIIEKYDFEFHLKIWFRILLKKNGLKYIQDWYQVYHYLIKAWRFQYFLFQQPNIMLFDKYIFNLNIIERYDFEFYWKIWSWILLKGMILNFIGRYDFECHWMIWFWIILKDMILNFIKNIFKILRRLISSLSSFNRSLTFSMFSSWTAK